MCYYHRVRIVRLLVGLTFERRRLLSDTESRLNPVRSTEIAVWAAAAGRCTFCNRLVMENEDLGVTVSIGELAHNVGWSDKSPRGKSELTAEERREASNLLLLCRTCHKPIDEGGQTKRYSIERLAEFKRDHEQRIRTLTEIGADRKATILRLVGPIRGASPELTYDTVLEATTAAKLFPALLPGSFQAQHDLDLRTIPDLGTPAHFAASAAYIDDLIRRVDDGINRNLVSRLAVFAFARIPVLIHLGARLDDKVPTLIFQRQRVDDVNAWRWPETPPEPPTFDLERVTERADPAAVALIVNLSGTIQLEELPEGTTDTDSVYSISPMAPAITGPTLISSPAALTSFDRSVRRFLATVEETHGKVDRVKLFAAVPVSAAITLGRVLMPHVSPAWAVYDRDAQRHFFEALEVRR